MDPVPEPREGDSGGFAESRWDGDDLGLAGSGLIELSGGVRVWAARDAGLVGVRGLAVGGLLEEVAVSHFAEPESGGRGWPVADGGPYEKVDGRTFWRKVKEMTYLVNSFGVGKYGDWRVARGSAAPCPGIAVWVRSRVG